MTSTYILVFVSLAIVMGLLASSINRPGKKLSQSGMILGGLVWVAAFVWEVYSNGIGAALRLTVTIIIIFTIVYFLTHKLLKAADK